MNHKRWIVLLLCAVLIPSVLAVGQNNEPTTAAQWQNRLVAANTAITALKANAVVKERLQNKLRVAATPAAIAAMTDDQLTNAIQNTTASNFSTWKEKLRELKATPAAVSSAKLRVIKARVTNAYKVKTWKAFDAFLAKHPQLATSCEAEVTAVKALATEAASDPSILVTNVTEVTAADEAAVPSSTDSVADLTNVKEARKNLLNCVVTGRLDTAVTVHKNKVEARVELHKQFATKIDNALAKLSELSSARVANGLSAIPASFKEALEKLKTLNSSFIEKGTVLVGQTPVTPKEKLDFIQQANRYFATSKKFQNDLRQALQWFVNGHNKFRERSSATTEIQAVETEATATTAAAEEVQTELATEPAPLSSNDPVAQVVDEAAEVAA